RDQIPYRGIFLPSVPDVVDGRSCPHGGNGDFRHFDLVARPIGEARIGGERRAPQGQFNGDGHGDGPTSHAPPPGWPRRARNPREGSYARIAPTMNRAVHPPTTASEIQLIWQQKINADHAHTAAANVDQTRWTSCDLICVRGATLPDVPTGMGKTIVGRREGMFDNLHDGPVTCVGAWVSQHFGITVPRKVHRRKVRGPNGLTLVTIRHSIPIDRASSAERSARLRRREGDGGLQMNSKWTKLAAAGALTLCTAGTALAGSVTQPGETVGLNAGTPLP